MLTYGKVVQPKFSMCRCPRTNEARHVETPDWHKKVLGIEVDVTDHEAVDAMVARVVQEWGRVDVLVANAGRSSSAHGHEGKHPRSGAPPARRRYEPLWHVYTVNAVAPIMKNQRSGKIITVSSVAGTAPSADGGYAHYYAAAKAAVAHYTRYLA
jgi:3-oxoacyl-[acyl-carrier protein] reductase